MSAGSRVSSPKVGGGQIFRLSASNSLLFGTTPPEPKDDKEHYKCGRPWSPYVPLDTPMRECALLGPCGRPCARGYHVGDSCSVLKFASCSLQIKLVVSHNKTIVMPSTSRMQEIARICKKTKSKQLLRKCLFN